jgi:hypothetical protein
VAHLHTRVSQVHRVPLVEHDGGSVRFRVGEERGELRDPPPCGDDPGVLRAHLERAAPVGDHLGSPRCEERGAERVVGVVVREDDVAHRRKPARPQRLVHEPGVGGGDERVDEERTRAAGERETVHAPARERRVSPERQYDEAWRERGLADGDGWRRSGGHGRDRGHAAARRLKPRRRA